MEFLLYMIFKTAIEISEDNGFSDIAQFLTKQIKK